MQNSLFGDDHEETIALPVIPEGEFWNNLEKLRKEKEVIGFYISGHPLDEYRFEIRSFCSHRIEQLANLEELKNREVSIAGILTEVNHRISKNGKPFGSFTVEDYTGGVQMVLFGEDYMKMKDYLAQESFVFIRAKVQNRFNAPDQYEVRPYMMQYLSDVSDKMAKSFTLKLPLSVLSEGLIDRLSDVLSASPGNCQVKIQVSDPVDNLAVDLPSRKLRIRLNRQLLEDLDAIGTVEYQVN